MTIDRQTWLLLILLSVLWGAAFFFIGVAVRELPPFTIVLIRVALGALLLVAGAQTAWRRAAKNRGRLDAVFGNGIAQ